MQEEKIPNLKQGEIISFKGDVGVVLEFYKNGEFYTLNFKGKKFSHSWTRMTAKEVDKIEIL